MRMTLIGLAALVAGAGGAVAQTVVVVDGSEALTTRDLLAGAFDGQTFTLGPDLVIEIDGGTARLGLEPELAVPGPIGQSQALDLRGATINLRDGGNLEVELFANAEVNVFTGGDALYGLSPFSGAAVNLLGRPASRYLQFFTNGAGRVSMVGGEFTRDGALIGGTLLDEFEEGWVYTATFPDGSVLAAERWQFQDPAGVSLVPAVLPPTSAKPMVVDTDRPDLRSVRPGESVRVVAGGALPAEFQAVKAAIDIEGGRAGPNMTVVDADLSVSGGEIGRGVDVLAGSTLHVSGGRVIGLFADTTSDVRVSGGVLVDANVYLSGITIVGGDFRADGKPVTELPPHPCDDQNVAGCDGDTRIEVVTATLADGTPLLLSNDYAQGRVVFESVPVPPVEPLDIVVDSASVPVPGLRPGQRLRLVDGGRLPEGFVSVGGTVVVEGGSVGTRLKVAAGDVSIFAGEHGDVSSFGASRLTIAGGSFRFGRVFAGRETIGTINDGRFGRWVGLSGPDSAISGGIFDAGASLSGRGGLVSGGLFLDSLSVYDDTSAVVTGGTFQGGLQLSLAAATITGGVFSSHTHGDALDVWSSSVDVEGGRFLTTVSFDAGAVATVRGGRFEGGWRIARRTTSGVPIGETVVELEGGPFFLDDEPLAGLVPGGSVVIEERGGVLTGWLASGEPVRIELNEDDSVFAGDIVSADAVLRVVWTEQGCGRVDLAEPIGQLGSADVQAFVDAFVSGDPRADLAFPVGTLDLSDANAFIAAFALCCP